MESHSGYVLTIHKTIGWILFENDEEVKKKVFENLQWPLKHCSFDSLFKDLSMYQLVVIAKAVFKLTFSLQYPHLIFCLQKE